MTKLKPYIASEKSLPEITFKALVLGVLLAIVMAGSNAYLGLKLGMTVSATIPAAVISMAILRFFKNSNVLENNIVQTAASAGEVVAAAVSFTLPALIMMRFWAHFPFWLTTSIILVGGLLGVLFSIPLRRAYVVNNSELPFPEGIATGEVLKAGDRDSSGGGAKTLMIGGLLSAVVKFAQTGLMVVGEEVNYWTSVGRSVFGFGSGFSLVLLAAGYIVGMQVGTSMLVGAILGWGIGVPLHGLINGLPDATSATEIATTIWSKNIRMVGVGAMVVGGLWTLVYLMKPIAEAMRSSMAVLKQARMGTAMKPNRVDYDIPMHYVLAGIVALTVPMIAIFHYILGGSDLGLSTGYHWLTVGVITAFALFIGFVCSAIAGYMAGLVGSSNNPLSGVTILAILSVSLILLLMLGRSVDFLNNASATMAAAALAIIIGAVVACSASVSCDNLQDLKAGQIVGATPWKQQVMLMIGVIAASLVMTPLLEVLFEAYGIGDVLPRPGMDPSHAMMAPKAAIMGTLATGVFAQTVDWTMFSIGAALAVAIIMVDTVLRKGTTGWRMPVLAVALGIYMPISVTTPVFIGGVIAALCEMAIARQRGTQTAATFTKKAEAVRTAGLLLASGLIAGEALTGIVLAAPFAAYQSTTMFKIAPEGFEGMATWIGAAVFCATSYYLYRTASRLKA